MKYNGSIPLSDMLVNDDTQLSLYEEETKSMTVDNWAKDVAVEKSSYYWLGDPVVNKGVGQLAAEKPIIVELFCGCGGTSIGFEMAGFEVALGCDILVPAIKTFKHNHPPATTILGDIKKVTSKMINDLLGGRRIDVLIAGVPCQGFSLNNRKRKENDDRNFMYLEFVRLVEELSPRAVVLENVSGMKSTGNFAGEIETSLTAALGAKVSSRLLYAPDYGVPQKRTRLVFVGVEGRDFSFDLVKATHGPTTDCDYVTVAEAIGDLPSLKNKETKTTYASKASTPYQKLMRSKKVKAFTGHTAPNHPATTVEKIKNTKPGEPMYPRFKQRIRLAWDILSPTQVSGGIRPQFQLGHPEDDRGLTIRERCRLQSFPDDFTVMGGTVQARVQTGNAVPPLLAKAVALAIKEAL
jgi:DNA (cytosine-5)-methyltransferase 1